MSDLQCPANVVLVPHSMLGGDANIPAPLDVHYFGVFVAASIAADAADLAHANALAQRCGCRLEVMSDAVDSASLARAVDDLADLHRGETIVVVAHHDMILHLIGRTLDAENPIEVAIDDTGWAVLQTPDR